MLNVPLSRSTEREDFRQALQATVLPRLRAFAPDILFLSAGFDAHADDPLGGKASGGPALLEEDFGWLTERIGHVAAAVCQGRLVSVLEGGYHPAVLRRCVRAHVGGLMEAATRLRSSNFRPHDPQPL